MFGREAGGGRKEFFRLCLVCTGVAAVGALLIGCGGSESKQAECQSMIEKAEHDVCVAELREERGRPASRHKEELTPEELAAAEEAAALGAGDEHVAEEAIVNFDETAVLSLKNEEGYTSKAEVERAPIERVRQGRINGDLSEGAGCEIDAETDAVEPIQLQVYNTTDGFSAYVGMALRAQTPHSEAPNVTAEIGYTEGPECIEMSGGTSQYNALEGEGELIAFTSNDKLPPGQFISAQGFLILDGYYSPDHPNGDPAGWANTILVLEPQYGGEDFTVSKAEGVLVPRGNQIVQNSAVHDAIAVIPGGKGGCLVQPPCEAAFKTE